MPPFTPDVVMQFCHTRGGLRFYSVINVHDAKTQFSRLLARAHTGEEIVLAKAEPNNEIWVSAASAWEVATKARIGKLADMPDAVARYPLLMDKNGFLALAISQSHALKAEQYPQAHRDPFDRLLAAQAKIEKMPLISRDPEFSEFDCETFW